MADYSYSQAPLRDDDEDYPANNNTNTNQTYGYHPSQDAQDDRQALDSHMAIDMANRNQQQMGHSLQLSESFYSEAANALGGNNPDPFYNSSHVNNTSNTNNNMTANLSSLIGANPYGDRDGGMLNTIPEYASGISGTESGPGRVGASSPFEEKSYDQHRGPFSSRSSEDDYSKGNDPFLGGHQVDYIPSPYAQRSDEEGTLDGATGSGKDGYELDYQNSLPREYDDGYYQEDTLGYDDDHGRSTSFNSAYTGAPGLMNANLETQHFGPAPARGAQLRRHKTKKNVKLTQGNLVLDCPVPTKLQTFLSRKGEEEFTTMRYSAVTCGPDGFPEQNFTLRPLLLNRHTELFIAITMYNEDEVLFCRTLHGVMKNIAHLCSRTKSRTWGPDGWKKVVVAIIADGRKKVHPRVLDCLAALGVYQEGVAKNLVNGKVVEAHVYEYTTQLSIDSNLTFKGAERGLVPMQIIFCLKEHNKKKINSHRWFFNAFAPVLQPNVCILLDVGTRPENKSIYYLWKAFDLNSNVAGACGEICADTGGKWGVGPALLNPLVAAQNFEYKISNILDKTTESTMGYISVLPGAFSAYRYIALQNDEMGQGPLASYFKGEVLHGADADVFTSNMYLAEDRILCFELAAKAGAGWVLKYVKSARGVTDVPDSLPEFISQRRRWLNGSFFAAVYSLTHTRQFIRSGHSFPRKVMLVIESFYSFINLAFAWFGLANYYVFFRLLTKGLEAPEFKLNSFIGVWNTIVQYIYLGTVVACFLFAMGNRPQGSKWKYFTAVVIFALLTVYMMIAAILCISHVVGSVHNAIYAQMIVSLLATYGVYLLSSLIACDPLHLVTSFIQYLLLSPTYINVLNIYAFCNLHDFSWGTKGDTTVNVDLGAVTSTGKGVVEIVLPTAQADIDLAYDESLNNLRTRPMIIKGDSSADEKALRRQDYYSSVRSNVVLAWALSNGLLAALILSGGDNTDTFSAGSGTTRQKVYMVLVLVFVAGMACIRFIGSTTYMLIRLISG